MFSLQTLRSRWTLTLLAVGSLLGSAQADGAPADSRPADGRPAVSSYTAPDGQTYMAVMLRADRQPADQPAKATGPLRHVVLFDTSASQVGGHRQQALDVLAALFEQLPAEDRVALLAVDLAARPMSDGFIPPRGEQAEKALAALQRRAPLGATDLAKGLRSASEQLDRLQPGETGSITYIGDGMSMAELMDADEIRTLLDELRERRVAVHSYAVGPRKDLQLLGVLAQRTGGVVLFDTAGDVSDAASAVGERLADAIHTPVVYPDRVALAGTDGTDLKNLEMLPAVPLPLRPDRETVFLAKGDPGDALRLAVTDGGRQADLSVPRDRFQEHNVFLRAVWNQAAGDDGLSVAFAGDRMLREAQSGFDRQVAGMVTAGEKAVRASNFDQAQRIARAVQELDPENVGARAVLQSAQKHELRLAAFQPPAGDSLLDDFGADAVDPAVDPGLDPDAPGVDEFNVMENVEDLIRFRTQKYVAEVNRRIEQARALAGADPIEALEMIKREQANLRAVESINPDVKQELLQRLQAVNFELANTLQIAQENEARLRERAAIQEAQERLVDLAYEDELELERLIDRVRALMDEARHGETDAYEEAEAVARAAVALEPGNGPAAAALFTAEAAGQLDKAFRLRSLRADRFLETLYQVELSHVPFPDEPPIRWPDPEVWARLTASRRQWASVDLHRNSPAEQRIQEALNSPLAADLEFTDNTLTEVLEFIADAHKITILPDTRSLQDAQIVLDEERLSLVLSGVTLRSALKIILEQFELAYVIEDEVMKILWEQDAENRLSTRVYPVGDLVVPVTNPMAMGGLGGGMMGGGMMGGGMMGGGMGGMGMGGGMGGMGGGMGGGFFNVPPQPLPMGRQPARAPAFRPQPAPAGAAAPARRPARPARDPEVDRMLDEIINGDKTSQVDAPFGRGLAQVRDDAPGGFRLDNETVEALKKKPLTAR